MSKSRSHKNQIRNYRNEYDSYQGHPEQIKNRSLRNQARRMYETSHGDQPSSMDVDHRTPLIRGGRNDASNLRAVSRKKNRSFARTKRAGMR